jgi:hypothetical protein
VVVCFVVGGPLLTSCAALCVVCCAVLVGNSKNFSSRHAVSVELGEGSQSERQAKRVALASVLVQRARVVTSALVKTFAAVDNPTRFPSLRTPVAPVVSTTTCL